VAGWESEAKARAEGTRRVKFMTDIERAP